MLKKQWCPLEAHTFKANFDAAVFKSDNVVGLGMVIRTGVVRLLEHYP